MEDPETLQRMLIQARSREAGPGEPEPPFTKRKFRVTGGEEPQGLGFRSAFEWISLVAFTEGHFGAVWAQKQLFNCPKPMPQKHSTFVVQPIGREQHGPMTRCSFVSLASGNQEIAGVRLK